MLRRWTPSLLILQLGCHSPGSTTSTVPVALTDAAASSSSAAVSAPSAFTDASSGGADIASGETLLVQRGRFEGAARIRNDVDATAARRALDATYSRYLGGPCPTVPAAEHAQTWTELDKRKAEATSRGLFRPIVVQRIDGRFTDASVDEVLFVIDDGECVQNGGTSMTLVVVAAAALVHAHGKLALRARESFGGWGDADHVVGVVTHGGLDVIVWRGGAVMRFAPKFERTMFSTVRGELAQLPQFTPGATFFRGEGAARCPAGRRATT
jgi:hypothetical protein